MQFIGVSYNIYFFFHVSHASRQFSQNIWIYSYHYYCYACCIFLFSRPETRFWCAVSVKKMLSRIHSFLSSVLYRDIKSWSLIFEFSAIILMVGMQIFVKYHICVVYDILLLLYCAIQVCLSNIDQFHQLLLNRLLCWNKWLTYTFDCWHAYYRIQNICNRVLFYAKYLKNL